jgi:hypothetical protein
MSELITDIERVEILETVDRFGLSKGSKIHWLHRFHSLPENQKLSRRQLEGEIVAFLRLCSKSSFDKLMVDYNKIRPHLMTRNLKDRIELMI